MYKRRMQETLLYAHTKFPVITLTGPRQSGKTTLVKETFPEKKYISLEDLDNREFAFTDPRGFLQIYGEGSIIDEVQHAPNLFSYIQSYVDTHKRMGSFILTGSQHFLLLEKITQSLAGRTCVLQLLPLSLQELHPSPMASPFEVISKGFYPGLYEYDISPSFFYKSYLNTYVERDVRMLKNIKDLSTFKTFLYLCAGRIGQLLNMSSLGNDCGIDQETVKSWLSILEASYILFLLRPHHTNFNKRLIKQPKLYFYDTGLASYLLGIETAEDLMKHFARGPLFENYVALELIKKRYNNGKESNLFFWRDYTGHEVDFLIDCYTHLFPIEVKSAQTIVSSFFDGLIYWQKQAPEKKGCIIYAGTQEQSRSQISILPWNKVDSLEAL